MKKGLIQDHCFIRLLPYHPQVWIDRGATFLALGYGELAAADGYKAHLLCRAASVEEIKAREPGDGSLTAKVFSTILSKIQQTEDQSLESYCVLVFSSIDIMHQRAYTILVKGLLSLNAWQDALAVVKAAIEAFPDYYEFEVLRRQCMDKHWLLENRMRIQGKVEETLNRMVNSGQLERVAYPWIAPKQLERSATAMNKLNAHFEAASENACIQKSPLRGAISHHGLREDDYGVFARRNIERGETILNTRSIWTDHESPLGENYCSSCCRIVPKELAIQMTCCRNKFCSQICMQSAKDTFHDIICRKDLGWLHEAYKGTDHVYRDNVPIMMVKILATAIHLNCKPLKVPCVRTLKANYDNVCLSKFTHFDNIVAPIRILETLGVDVFTNLKFDSWVLQTLLTRVQCNSVGKETLDNRKYSAVDPLLSIFNHSCLPSAAPQFIGGSTETIVKALRNIKNGEEIFISYVDPGLPEEVRRGKISKLIGKPCDCQKCRMERRAQDIQRFLRDMRVGEMAIRR